MRSILAPLLALLLMATGLCAEQSEIPKTKPKTVQAHPRTPAVKRKPYQVGRASWYGKFFHGRKTASGEAYDMFRFTAAHPALPLGTLVKVTSLESGAWVIVRVNDRGPVRKSRIIDLSYGAAQMLGLRRAGIEKVRLDLVEPTEIAMARGDTLQR